MFGFRAQWLWTILFGAVAVGLALLGPIGFVRRYVRKFAVWFVVASLGYLTWWVIDKSDLTRLLARGRQGRLPDVLAGRRPDARERDLVDAARRRLHTLRADEALVVLGRSVGYLIPVVWLYSLGVLLLLARDISDPAQLPAAVVSGGVVSVLALFAVTVDESDEAFANVYSTAVSLQNVVPQVSQRLLIVASAVLATAGALVLDLSDFATFLFLLGSFFVPLLGVLIADWLLEGRHYTRDTIFRGPAFRPEMILAWIVGFGLFQWLSPQGPAWWTRLLGHTDPAPIDFTASLPSFAAAFGLALLAGLLFGRPARAPAET